MSELALRAWLSEEESLVRGSSQIFRFTAGIVYAMYGFDVPDGHYPGELTRRLAAEFRGKWDVRMPFWQLEIWAMNRVLEDQIEAMEGFGCRFDTWSSERALLSPIEAWLSVLLVVEGATLSTPAGLVCTQCGRDRLEGEVCQECMARLRATGVLP